MSLTEQMLDRPDFREQIYREIDLERVIQDLKFPRSNTKSQWMAVLSMWLGKAAKASLAADETQFQRRLKQLAAISINALERGWREDSDAEELEDERMRDQVAGLANELGGDHQALARTLAGGAEPRGLTLVQGGRPVIDEDSEAAEDGRELALAHLEEQGGHHGR